MKKYLIYIITFFLFCLNVNAETIYKVKVTYSGVTLREGPGTNYTYMTSLKENGEYELLTKEVVKSEKGCTKGWYHIKVGASEGYFCSSYGETFTEEKEEFVPSDECVSNLKDEGFPDSYIDKLCMLKEKYSNWTFIMDDTGLDFSEAVSKESTGNRSFIQTSYQGYLSVSPTDYDFLTDTFVVKEGSNWYAAHPDVVAYYLDPRNFLNEEGIFMFEKLSFDESYQTIDAINAILLDKDIKEYAQTIYDVASDKDIMVNAIYLASKIRQETGGNYTNSSIAGNPVTYNNKTYDAVYNPYNIGANTGSKDGLVWAVAGTSYLRPWTSLETAIKGGALFISNDYVSRGQDTVYFQKFNTSSYADYNSYAHQYMSNIRGASSEAKISFEGYSDADGDLLNTTDFRFIIPVYENMAESYSLPNTGNPNNHLKNILINDIGINGFVHDNYEYTYYVSKITNEIEIKGELINDKAHLNGNGKIKLEDDTTEVILEVTAQNKTKQEYKITVIKTDGIDYTVSDIIANSDLSTSDNYIIYLAGAQVSDLQNSIQKIAATAEVFVEGKEEGALATGDHVTVKNGEDEMNFNIVVKADANGDGNINIQDLLRVQKFILNYASLEGSYFKAADTNQDGAVNVVDLLRIQKYILGYITIE